jgi:spore coat protein H
VREQIDSSVGATFKPVTPNLFSDLGDDWKDYNQTYDPKGSLTDTQKQRIIEFCKFTTNATDEQFAEKLNDFIDLDNFARYLAITT